MADQINISQVLGQVEGELEPSLKVSQVLGQVEIVTNPTGIYVYQMLGQIEYLEEAGPGVRRIFPVPSALNTWQSQAGKRKFPVVMGAS